MRKSDGDKISQCTDCGGEIIYYHAYGGITRAICKLKCQGWKIIEEIDRRHKKDKQIDKAEVTG